jgi:2,3-bisphosphoglycerate-independent phosphoglycerate mutase
MSAYEVTERLLNELDRDDYDFIVVNFANPDMVGHTGVISAAVKAVETVDICIGKLIDKLKEKEGRFIITADHGNAEEMLTADGEPMTAHSTNRVPCIVGGMGNVSLREDGKLSDLAPTLLEMMEIKQPVEMTGKTVIMKA